jgi:hypothetical protein
MVTAKRGMTNRFLVKENPVEVVLSHITLICRCDFSFSIGIS